MEKTRVCVVGVGYLGEHHARILSQLENVELAGVVDADPKRADEIARKYQTSAYEKLSEIIDKVDAAVVAVPTVSHFETAMTLISAGKDILLEKPIAANIAEANQLVEEAENRKLIFQIGHLERFNGAVMELADHLSTPMFIESHRLGPFAARGTDVDVALDLMIHDIDVLLSIVKSKVKDVRAVGVPVLSNTVDIANARIEFESGCVANITASRVSFEKIRKLRIFQPETYISLDYQTQAIKVYKKTDPVKGETGTIMPGILVKDIHIEKGEPLRNELISFIDCIRTRNTPVVSGRDGRDALDIAMYVKEQTTKQLATLNSIK